MITSLLCCKETGELIQQLVCVTIVISLTLMMSSSPWLTIISSTCSHTLRSGGNHGYILLCIIASVCIIYDGELHNRTWKIAIMSDYL